MKSYMFAYLLFSHWTLFGQVMTDPVRVFPTRAICAEAGYTDEVLHRDMGHQAWFTCTELLKDAAQKWEGYTQIIP
jgi:hypothetical protein